MDQRACQVFMNYLNRCVGIIPTTIGEVGAFDDVLTGLRRIAEGEVTCELKSKAAPEAAAADNNSPS